MYGAGDLVLRARDSGFGLVMWGLELEYGSFEFGFWRIWVRIVLITGTVEQSRLSQVSSAIIDPT